MWVCLNNAFLSIVEPNRGDKGSSPVLLVRARRLGDIETVFPDAKVEKRPERDYLFRALISREDVGMALMAQAMGINYNNFKDSVRDHKLHDAYAAFWSIHARLQPTAPYSGGISRRQGKLV
ncbi:hypothetical protein [Tardiphaga sp. 862_B3_N1_1]|uniref:hypothetical protein n=1 Tax=Tardiphaga sp. 862_B3_N1_1 TaxID=3240763 RepID=UPI003F8BEA22